MAEERVQPVPCVLRVAIRRPLKGVQPSGVHSTSVAVSSSAMAAFHQDRAHAARH